MAKISASICRQGYLTNARLILVARVLRFAPGLIRSKTEGYCRRRNQPCGIIRRVAKIARDLRSASANARSSAIYPRVRTCVLRSRERIIRLRMGAVDRGQNQISIPSATPSHTNSHTTTSPRRRWSHGCRPPRPVASGLLWSDAPVPATIYGPLASDASRVRDSCGRVRIRYTFRYPRRLRRKWSRALAHLGATGWPAEL